MKGLEGLTIDEKYEIEEYRDMMKAFAAAATDGILEQVNSFMLVRLRIFQFHFLIVILNHWFSEDSLKALTHEATVSLINICSGPTMTSINHII